MDKVDRSSGKSWEQLAWEWDKSDRRRRIYTFAGITLMIFIAIFTLSFVYGTISSSTDKIRQLENEIEILSETISLQDIYFSGIAERISESPQSVDVNINKIVEKLDSDYKKLQEIIVENPATIIEFALLIREVDSLKESHKEHKESVYKEMDRSFGLFQWFIYMNIIIALAILGIAVTTYNQSKSIQKTKDKEPSEETPKVNK